MKILVTGSNGFLGSALVERLIAHGESDIRCLVRSGSDRSRLEALQQRRPDICLDLYTGSLHSVESAKEVLEGVSVVYHLAAGVTGTPADLFLNTVVTSKKLLEAALAQPNIKIVLVSSFGVYGVASLPKGYTVTEQTPLEECPAKRDSYSYSKLRQEQLFWEYSQKYNLPLVVLRPGVIYGDSGSEISARVGIKLPGLFLVLGRNNLLPLTHVENCAEAIVIAGKSEQAIGQVYNVVDDHLPTCRQYLRQFKTEVQKMRTFSLPYPATQLLSKIVEWYHIRSQGQLPAFLTPYRTASLWKGNTFSNTKLKALGWKPFITTEEGLQRTFATLRQKRQNLLERQ